MVNNAYKIYLFFDRSDANGSGESGRFYARDVKVVWDVKVVLGRL